MIYPEPSYLKGLVTEVSPEKLPQIQKDYGNNTTAFKFNSKFNALIQTWLDEFKNCGGTIWAVDTTGKQLLLFDQFKHGYNGMMQINEKEDLDTTKSIDFPQATEIIIAFQYSGDEAEYLSEGSSKFAQDYFNWLVLYKQTNNGLEELLSYECA